MFAKNAWYVAARKEEVDVKPLARTFLNEPVVLYRDKKGVVAALEDRCCHRGAPLSLGWCGEQGIICGYHGMEFDRTGNCVYIPGTKGKIPAKARVGSYPVVEKNNLVWIWMGDTAKADITKIVDYPPDDPKNWPQTSLYYKVKSSYIYAVENLMDLSHLSWLHRNTNGSAPEDSANAKVEVKSTATGIKFLRTMLNAQPSKHVVRRYGISSNVDRWSDFEYVAPSNVVQWSGAVRAGDYENGIREGGPSNRILHALTPETENTCHYFVVLADGGRNYLLPGQENQQSSGSDVIEEDIVMLEAQQARLIGYDHDKLIDIPSDIVRVQMMRFLTNLIDEERKNKSFAAE